MGCAFIINVYCYTRIVLHLKRYGVGEDIEQRLLFRAIAFIVLFLVGWGPAVVACMKAVSSHGDLPEEYDLLLAICGSLHSPAVPLVYGAFMTNDAIDQCLHVCGCESCASDRLRALILSNNNVTVVATEMYYDDPRAPAAGASASEISSSSRQAAGSSHKYASTSVPSSFASSSPESAPRSLRVKPRRLHAANIPNAVEHDAHHLQLPAASHGGVRTLLQQMQQQGAETTPRAADDADVEVV